MTRTPYTYTVLRYSHDPAAGEYLNIGVLVYSREARFLDVRFERSYGRLSAAFAGFDGRAYRRRQADFVRAVTNLREFITAGTLEESEIPADAASVVARLWPDRGLSFRAGELLGGLSGNLSQVTGDIFERFVASQFTKKDHHRRDDADVWQTVETKLDVDARDALEPRLIKTKNYEYTFERTFQNERLHVVEPISFDYVDAGTILETATKWRGRLDILTDAPEVEKGAFHIIVGGAKDEHRASVTKARRILEGASVKPEVIDEEHSGAFAKRFSEEVRTHMQHLSS